MQRPGRELRASEIACWRRKCGWDKRMFLMCRHSAHVAPQLQLGATIQAAALPCSWSFSFCCCYSVISEPGGKRRRRHGYCTGLSAERAPLNMHSRSLP
jgi:hypothetical protein